MITYFKKRSMVLFVIGLIAVGTIFLLSFGENACMARTDSAEMVVSDNGFQPATLTIQRCTRVVFKNAGTGEHWPASDLHPTHLIYPEFDPQKPIESGSSWEFVFDRVGKWKCHDHLNPKLRCIVEVQE